jgi:cell division transport system permease protein
MTINEIRYIVGEATLTLWRRKGANMLATVIMGLSLLILVVFILVTLNIARIIDQASEELRFYVYLTDGIAQEVTQGIQVRLLGIEGVEEVAFVSKEEALGSFRETLGEGGDIIDALEDNPLPDAYRVKLKSEFITSGHLERIATNVGTWEGVEEVRYGKRWFERGEQLVRTFYIIDLVLGIIIFLSVVFVISNTVRLTILQKKRTIEVMKLVGATNVYIQIPFVIEGALQGVAATLLAMSLLTVVYVVGKRYLTGLIFFGAEAVVGFVIFCALLGALGSYTAMRRFLKL